MKIVRSQGQEYSTVVSVNGGTELSARAEALFTRGFLFLEDGEFGTAGDYFNQGLDLEPTNDKGYIGLLLVKLRLKKESGLELSYVNLKQFGEFQKALRFAPPERKERYQEYGRLAEQEAALRKERYQECGLKCTQSNWCAFSIAKVCDACYNEA